MTKEKSSLTDIKQFTFSKGIYRDVAPELQPENTYRMALNIVKESSEGDLGYLTTEYSNIFKLDLPGKILHSNLIKQLNIFVLFLDNNEIGIYYPNDNIYKSIYKSKALDFNYYVESVSFTKTECEDIVLIFWDGKNRIKNINISKSLKKLESKSGFCCEDNTEDLDLFKTASSCIKLSRIDIVENVSFNVEAGSYMPFIQYEDDDYNQSNIYIINENIPLIDDIVKGDYRYIDGNKPLKLNKALRLKFENLDLKYKYINIGLIRTLNGIKTSFIFKKRHPVAETITVDYKGDTGNEYNIDLQEVFTPKAFYLSAKHGLLYNNQLLLAGVKGFRNINYQKYANNIKVSYVTSKISIKKTKGYKNPEHIIHHKSWMRDENYMLGIIWEFEDMTESAVFPLIGRDLIPERDLKYIPTNINGVNSISKDLDLCCTEDIKYWKVANTAYRTSFNSFSNPLSVTDYCSKDYNNDLNTIRSTGDLGYFETTERYPVLKDCNGEYMFPTETVDGEIVGKNIRLFKMPDSTIEPFHNNIEDKYAIEGNRNRHKDYYDDLEIYPLGLKFENIEFPTDSEVKVNGYRIVYVKRETFNKTIQDKGWFVEMFKNSWADKNYIYPKHNVNAGAKWDYFSNHYNKTLETGNTVNDFITKSGFGSHYNKGIMFYGGNTMYTKKGINVNHVKIEQQYSTKGYYIDSIKGENTKERDPGGDASAWIDPSEFRDKDGRGRRTSIQIYNMYNYENYAYNGQTKDLLYGGFHNKNSGFKIKNICVDNYSYVGDNLILNKIANSEFNLVNFYRESGFYLDFKDETDLCFSKNERFNDYTLNLSKFNSDTSSKKCKCGDLGNDYYYSNYIEGVTNYNLNKLDSCNLGYIYYGSIKNYIDNQYGRIEDMEFIDTGLKSCSGNSLIGFYGDSYINTFSFIRTGVTGMLEDSRVPDASAPWMNTGDKIFNINDLISSQQGLSLSLYLMNKANVTLINTITESDYNLDLRHEGNEFNDMYYPKLQNGKYDLYSLKKQQYADDCFLNSYFYDIVCADPGGDGDSCSVNLSEEVEYNDVYRNFHDNQININKDYLQYNGIKPFYSVNENYKTCDCDTEYDNRIIISSKDNETISRNNYSKFLKNSFITVPHKEGKITNLLELDHQLFAHTTDTIWKLQTLESKLQTNNNTVYIGTNDLLSSQPLNMYISNEGYGGLQNKINSYQNQYGYFFIDLKSQSLNHFSNNNITPISNYGLRNLFKELWNPYFNSYMNLANSNFKFGFDYRHKRLLLTDLNNNFTISYYPEDKAFYSLHSYIPNFYIQNRDTFFTQTGNSLYLHEDNFNSYRTFNGVIHPSFVEGVFNNSPFRYNILNNISFKIDSYKKINNQLLSADLIPDTLEVWTDKQHSGVIKLSNKIEEDYMQSIVRGDFSNRIEGNYVYNNIFNYVLDDTKDFLEGIIIQKPNTNVSFEKDWNTIDRLNNNWYTYRLTVDNNITDTKFIYKSSLFNHNISIR